MAACCPEVVEEETGVLPAPPFPSPCPRTAGTGLRKRLQCFRIDTVAFLPFQMVSSFERDSLFGGSAEDHSTEPAVTNGKCIAPPRSRVPVPEHRVGGRKRGCGQGKEDNRMDETASHKSFQPETRFRSGCYSEPFTHGVLPMGCPPPTLTSTFAAGTSAAVNLNFTWRLSPGLR